MEESIKNACYRLKKIEYIHTLVRIKKLRKNNFV